MPWNDLINAINKTKFKAKIEKSTYLNQGALRKNNPRRLTLIFAITSLKKLKNLIQSSKIKVKKKPTFRPNKELRSLKSLKSLKKLKKIKKKLERKTNTTRRQHFSLKNKYNSGKKKNGQGRNRQRPNVSQITFYNRNKKDHYAYKYLKLKNSYNLSNFYISDCKFRD